MSDKEVKIADCVGKRVLISSVGIDIMEAHVLEVSPSGEYVLLHFPHTTENLGIPPNGWFSVRDVWVEEVLGDIPTFHTGFYTYGPINVKYVWKPDDDNYTWEPIKHNPDTTSDYPPKENKTILSN